MSDEYISVATGSAWLQHSWELDDAAQLQRLASVLTTPISFAPCRELNIEKEDGRFSVEAECLSDDAAQAIIIAVGVAQAASMNVLWTIFETDDDESTPVLFGFVSDEAAARYMVDEVQRRLAA